jgi:hypothetical protein
LTLTPALVPGVGSGNRGGIVNHNANAAATAIPTNTNELATGEPNPGTNRNDTPTNVTTEAPTITN